MNFLTKILKQLILISYIFAVYVAAPAAELAFFQQGVAPEVDYEMDFANLNAGCPNCFYTTEGAFQEVGHSNQYLKRMVMRWDIQSLRNQVLSYKAARVKLVVAQGVNLNEATSSTLVLYEIHSSRSDWIESDADMQFDGSAACWMRKRASRLWNPEQPSGQYQGLSTPRVDYLITPVATLDVPIGTTNTILTFSLYENDPIALSDMLTRWVEGQNAGLLLLSPELESMLEYDPEDSHHLVRFYDDVVPTSANGKYPSAPTSYRPLLEIEFLRDPNPPPPEPTNTPTSTPKPTPFVTPIPFESISRSQWPDPISYQSAIRVTTEGVVLFAFDDYAIPRLRNLCFDFGPITFYEDNPILARKSGNELGGGLDIAFYGTVLYVEGKFRMWYNGIPNAEPWSLTVPAFVCYAESENGIDWETPDLGLYEWDNPWDNPDCQLSLKTSQSLSLENQPF